MHLCLLTSFKKIYNESYSPFSGLGNNKEMYGAIEINERLLVCCFIDNPQLREVLLLQGGAGLWNTSESK